MPFARHHVLTLTDYFEVERASPTRHEFSEGQVLAMAGGSPRHNYLSLAISASLRERLRQTTCFPMGSDQRIATPDGLYTYADGAVFCGSLQSDDGQTATNPVVLIEVLSDSTRTYDRGEKLERYKTIASLRHVLLVETDAIDVEVWTRAESGWVRAVFVHREDAAPLPAIAVELPVAELYDGIDRLPR